VTSLIQFLYLGLFSLTPLIFTSINSELFELPKMYFVYLATLLIVFFHSLNWQKGQVSLFQKNKLQLFFSLFLLSQLISTIFSIDVHTSLFGYYSRLNGGLFSLLAYYLLFSVLQNYLQPDFKNKIIKYSLGAGFFVAIYGILEHFGIDKHLWVQDVENRVFSTLGQPNWLAAYLCILLPLAIDKFLSAKTILQKSCFLFLVSSFYLCLLFTKSKSGLAAGAISIIIFLIIYIIKNLKSLNKNSFAKVAVIATFFLISSLSINNPIKDYLFPSKISNSSFVIDNSLNITPSGDIRKIVWEGAKKLWQSFPIFGTGPETFAYTYYWTRPASHNLTSEWDFLYNKAHNEYLNYLATTGTFGFLTYLLLIISTIYIFLKNIFSPPFSREGPGVGFSIAFLASFISILITNFAGFSVVVISLFFFLIPTLNSSKPSTKTTTLSKKSFLYLPIIILITIQTANKIISFYFADIAYNRSLIYSEKTDYSTSQKYIDTALSLRQDEALYHSQASLVASKLNQIETAINESNLALSLSPSNTNLWKERAQVFSTLAVSDPQYFGTAIDALEKVSRLAPTDAKTFYLLGRFLEAASQNETAIKNYLHAIELKSNYDYAYFSLGQLYFENKNYSAAQKYFELTLKYAPTNLDAKNNLDKIEKLLVK